MVVQVDELLPRSMVIVAPMSFSAQSASSRCEIEFAGGEQAQVLVEQLGAVDSQ